MTTPPLKIQPSPNVIVQVLNGEAVLLHLKSEEYYTLDETGVRIWQLLSEHGEQEAVIAQIQEEFEVDEKTARLDVTRLISELSQEGLLDDRQE